MFGSFNLKGINRAFCAFCMLIILCGCANGKRKLAFVSGGSVHLWGDHEHAAMCEELARMVNESMGDSVEAVWVDFGKDFDMSRLKGADALVIVCEGEQNHPFASKTALIKALNDSGVNIGAVHYSLMFSSPADNAVLDTLIGGHYQNGFSYNPFYEANFTIDNSAHPVLNGVSSFGFYDEWHFNIQFASIPGQKITPILKTQVPDSLRRRRSAPAPVRAALGKGRLETVAWLAENANGTRGFGFMGGHSPWPLAQKDFRKLLLNMCAWLAHIDIPENGFEAKAPDFDSIASKIKKPIRSDYENYVKKMRAAFDKWIAEAP